jgi:hypothetical protein
MPSSSRGEGLVVAPPTDAIELLAELDETAIAQLAEILVDCVAGGASVSFMAAGSFYYRSLV